MSVRWTSANQTSSPKSQDMGSQPEGFGHVSSGPAFCFLTRASSTSVLPMEDVASTEAEENVTRSAVC